VEEMWEPGPDPGSYYSKTLKDPTVIPRSASPAQVLPFHALDLFIIPQNTNKNTLMLDFILITFFSCQWHTLVPHQLTPVAHHSYHASGLDCL
jgi:hypothetical protein